MVLRVFIDIISFMVILFLFMTAISMISINVAAIREQELSFGKAFTSNYLLAIGEYKSGDLNEVFEWV